MPDVAIITLARTPHKIRRLTLRQLRDLGFGSPTTGAAVGHAHTHMADVVAAALSRENPMMTADRLFRTEISGDELQAAHRSVLLHSGLQLKADESGAGTGGIDWGDLIGLLATGCGRLPAEVAEMTLPEADEMLAYWRKQPPAHILLAWAHGWKPKATVEPYARATKISPSIGIEEKPMRPTAPEDPSGMAALIKAAKAGGGEVSLEMLLGVMGTKH